MNGIAWKREGRLAIGGNVWECVCVCVCVECCSPLFTITHHQSSYSPLFTIIHHYSPLFTTIHKYSPLFTRGPIFTIIHHSRIHHYSQLFTMFNIIHHYSQLFKIIHYHSLLFTIDQHYSPNHGKLENLPFRISLHGVLVSLRLRYNTFDQSRHYEHLVPTSPPLNWRRFEFHWLFTWGT